MKKMQIYVYAVLVICLIANNVDGRPHRILLDTDVDVDDVLALLYILKLDRSIFDLKAITINPNSWTNAGHAISEVYDLLYMMGRDDIAVGVGGEGGILEDGTILSDVGGYLPIIDQGCGTVGYTRYSQVNPLGPRGRLDIDTKYGIKKSFLPQAWRTYIPQIQPTTQQVMIDTISAGPTTIFLISPTTNLAIFLMSNPHLKKNIQGIYILGGSLGPRLVGCPNDSTSTCRSGNIYTGDDLALNSEYNFFNDPFAAYQVMHSGIPITLVPLGCTDTIPITPEFLEVFEKNQKTLEAQYCFNVLKMVRDTWFNDEFYQTFFMWDSLLVGMATSTMLKHNNKDGENEFTDVAYKRITVVTSNEPYGIFDGSNPLFPYRSKPKFNLTRNGVHSGHVVRGLEDAFCVARNGCKDGYTPEINGPEGVRVLVAIRAKPNPDRQSKLDKAFYKHFLDVMNRKNQTGKFNYTTQFPKYRDVSYIPDFKGRKLGKTVIFDMDMSPGDFLALIHLLKVPVEVIHLKAIVVTPTGWASAATIDRVYDILHIMKRDDILVGLGDLYATNLTHPSFDSIGSSKYRNSIQRGAGGLLDSDTLYGLASYLQRAPRRYTAENSREYGAPRDTSHPELRQPLALEVWNSVKASLKSGSKVTILTNGPLTSLAKIIRSDKGSTSFIQEVIVVGGYLGKDTWDRGNVVNVPCNKYAELNMYLDPLAAKTVFDSGLNITLVPLEVQRKVQCFSSAIKALDTKNTPEASFTKELLSIWDNLNNTNPTYSHLGMFLGEVVGSVILDGQDSFQEPARYWQKKVKVSATGDLCEDGEMSGVGIYGKSLVRILKRVAPSDIYNAFANRVGAREQSAGFKSFFNGHRNVSKEP